MAAETLPAGHQPALVRKRLLIFACCCAIAYGLVARAYFGLEWPRHRSRELEGVFSVMSVAFIFGVPLSIGFISTFAGKVWSLKRSLWVPQLPALTALGLSLLLAWEGLICIFLWLPLFSLQAAIGGLLGSLALRLPWPNARRSTFGVALLLPYGAMLPESTMIAPAEVRRVETVIDIAAPPAAVWAEIVEVPAIEEHEHHFAWSHLIGFPRPVAAVTDGRGVGSIREASFERGVVFVEKVTTYDEPRTLSFTIHADADSIPARALDQHVTVGGPYFDVLQGTYRIEPTARGVRLRLWSEHRLSTHFNGYAGWWTDFIMRDTQQYILEVVARRAETRFGRAAARR